VLTGGLNRTDGPEPRGTINAVFEYLHLIGFRFYTPYSADSHGEFDSTKPKPSAVFPSCAGLKSSPSFTYRSAIVHNLLDSCANCPQKRATDRWWVANHMNGGGDRTGNYISTVIPFEMGGQLMFSNDTCTSSIFSLVPPVTSIHKGSYDVGQYDAHPEWFSLLPRHPAIKTSDGRECIKSPSSCVRSWNISDLGVPGQPGLASLCLSNPAMRQYMINHTLQKLRWDAANLGGVELINLADNDSTDDGLCHCAKCVAHRERDRVATLPCASRPGGCGSYGLTDTKYRGAAGLSLEVGSLLQGALQAEFPDVDVWVQSYHAQLEPPLVTRPANGVKVQFTTLHMNFGQPLIHPSNNITYDQLIGWTKIMPRGDIGVWDYFTDFNHPLVLLPNWFKMVEDIKLYGALGVSALNYEGNGAVQTADLHAMRAWVCGQLAWDAERDGLALIREFLVNYYSDGAANYILEHMHAYTDEIDRQNYYVTPADAPTAGYFTPSVIYTSLSALNNALRNATAAGETLPRPTVLRSIASLRLSPWFIALSNWEALCVHTRAHALPWPLAEASRHASLASFASNVTALLGATSLATEAAALATMNASRDLTCL
jgi:hypothetical protein